MLKVNTKGQGKWICMKCVRKPVILVKAWLRCLYLKAWAYVLMLINVAVWLRDLLWNNIAWKTGCKCCMLWKETWCYWKQHSLQFDSTVKCEWWFESTGMWCNVIGLVCPDVPNECSAFIFSGQGVTEESAASRGPESSTAPLWKFIICHVWWLL